MRKILPLFFLALAMQPSSLRASGELTAMPSFYFKAQKADFSRIGLYIDEKVAPRWSYISWIGAGKVFQDSGTPPVIQWYSTSQDMAYKVTDRFSAGAGAGASYTDTAHTVDADAHMRLSWKLW